MLRMRLAVNETMMQALKELPDRAKRNLKRKMQTELKPELQQAVNSLFAQGPGPVSSPFQFNTAKSRRYFFFLVRTGLVDTDGSHYLRTNIIESGWRVAVAERLQGALVTITNIQFSRAVRSGGFRNAVYVYGPRLVLGHIATGWPDQFLRAQQEMMVKVNNRIYELWSQAVDEAVKRV